MNPRTANVGLRRRRGGNRWVDGLPNLHPAPDPEIIRHIRAVVQCILNLDLEAAQFLTEGTSLESQRVNIRHHFEHRYPAVGPILRWLNTQRPVADPRNLAGSDSEDSSSDSGDDSYENTDDEDGDDINPLDSLTLEELLSILRERNAKKFWPRMMRGRISILKDKTFVEEQMRQDFRVAFELALGMLLERAPATQNEYITLVYANLQQAQLRLKAVVVKALQLRDAVRRAEEAATAATARHGNGNGNGNGGGGTMLLDKHLLNGLTQRLVALQEPHYYEAWTMVKGMFPEEPDAMLIDASAAAAQQADLGSPAPAPQHTAAAAAAVEQQPPQQHQPLQRHHQDGTQPTPTLDIAPASTTPPSNKPDNIINNNNPSNPSNPSASFLLVLSLTTSTLALAPAWASAQQTPPGPGVWGDTNFWQLASGVVFQLAGLATQILAPVVFPATFHTPQLSGQTRAVAWGVSAAATVCAVLSAVLYGGASAQWAGVVGWAAQAFVSWVQLLLVFGGG